MNLLVMILMALVALIIGPMLFLWSLNTLCEIGGSTFYIDHTVWSYLTSIVFLAVMSAKVSIS